MQQAGKLVLEPIFEAHCQATSDGFRPQRRAHQAVNAVTHALIRGWWGVDADLHHDFDTIDPTRLVSLVARRLSDRRVLKRSRQGRTVGVVERGQWQPTEVGSPPGGVGSPLLAHLAWHVRAMDWVTREAGLGERCRYADASVMICRPQRQAAHAVHAGRRILQTRKRQLHPTKTRLVGMAQEGFDCLGCHCHKLRAKRTGKLRP